MSITKNLTGEIFVKGNFQKILQSYNIKYYEPEKNFPLDKIWIYLNGSENGEPRTIRSLCFENPEAHRKFITNNIFANLFILERRVMDYSDIQITPEYKKRLLDALLAKIRGEILKRWKENLQKIKANGVYQPH